MLLNVIALNSQAFIQPNMGSYASPLEKGSLLINSNFSLRDYGFVSDFTLMYSPIKSLGLGITKRQKENSNGFGASIGHYFTNRNGYNYELYLGIDHERNRRSNYSIWHNTYYTQIGIGKTGKKFSHNFYARASLLDFTKFYIKRIDGNVSEVQKIVDKDPYLFYELGYKLSYGNEKIKGYAMLNKVLKMDNPLLHQDLHLSLGVQVNIQLFAKQIYKTMKGK